MSKQTPHQGSRGSARVILFFATGFGIGYFPWLPGTAGALSAVPLSLGLNAIAAISLPIALLTLAGAICCAIWLSTSAALILEQKDPPVIVIDEIVGFMVANFMAPQSVMLLGVAFLLFRFFDIVKVYPSSRLEKLPGGAGIVLDDVMAGLYVFGILRLVPSWGLL
ncbi:MAG: phosphatidylglycerophosphatase A [Deltaproteobacteria bacterium]|nr:phosphatidylglycerophosphatase A [Deltaproteobacteria bacterium]MBI2183000.1 phosphatidylglycerophosphatase A [Deltaproteobacteria bacterium]MBI2229756.1 phosphatidylglycerophosphatase A [Deltaproteobacteria bacterium]MBI2364957.1 phosphatidylglycerophosphatase A [Deltaproteobacteria bacterium]MBI2532725.1 phosphatidylglycerophosphatase A [Deltaproteobacteria bacterium]